MSQANNKPPMKTAAEALEHLLSQAKPMADIELVRTQDALGRILASDILSQVDVPPMNNTQMDGYAVRVADVAVAGQSFSVSQRIPAGHVGTELTSGTIARIFTGATIPPGADAVVMQEDCVVNGDQVTIQEVPKQGQWIRLRGEDLKAGCVALSKGTYLRAQELGVAASAGYHQLPVTKKIKVAAFFTGDELTLPGHPLKPGAIYNSNRDTLLACIRSLGCDATDLGTALDYLLANDIGDALATVAFVANSNTYVYQQIATTAGTTGGHILVQLTGITGTSLMTTGTTASGILIS